MGQEGVEVALLKRVLIGNRGEIAIRIAKAASALGLDSVGVYAPVDSLSLHTRFTTEARQIGGPGGGEGDSVGAYLDAEALVESAKASGCDCVHPGYGFLSESAAFAARSVSTMRRASLTGLASGASAYALLPITSATRGSGVVAASTGPTNPRTKREANTRRLIPHLIRDGKVTPAFAPREPRLRAWLSACGSRRELERRRTPTTHHHAPRRPMAHSPKQTLSHHDGNRCFEPFAEFIRHILRCLLRGKRRFSTAFRLRYPIDRPATAFVLRGEHGSGRILRHELLSLFIGLHTRRHQLMVTMPSRCACRSTSARRVLSAQAVIASSATVNSARFGGAGVESLTPARTFFIYLRLALVPRWLG